MDATDIPGGIAATSWGPGRLDLFWVEEDRGLWHRAWVAGAWQPSESLGGSLASSPAVTTWAEGQMEVFAVMDDGQLWDRYWDGMSWHVWESLGGELDPSATPTASSSGPDRLDVLARGRDGAIWVPWETAG